MTIREGRKKNSALSNNSWITWGSERAPIQRLTLRVSQICISGSHLWVNFEDKAFKPTASDRQHLSLLERVSRAQSIDSKTPEHRETTPTKRQSNISQEHFLA